MKISLAENGRVLAVLTGFIIVLAILWGTNPPAKDALGAYLIFAGVAWFIYRFSDFRKNLIGIKTDNIGVSLGWALLFAGGFWMLTKIFPGVSIGLPVAPQAIGENLRFILIVLFAPIAEELLFRGVLLGFLLTLKPLRNRLQLALIIQALLFGIAHLTAYITGFYDYPTFTETFSAFNANIASFLAAGIFGYLVGLLVTRNGIRNMIFAIIAHLLFNLIILTGFSVIIS